MLLSVALRFLETYLHRVSSLQLQLHSCPRLVHQCQGKGPPLEGHSKASSTQSGDWCSQW